MAKKKQPRKITVKNPKIGTKYYFKFAGSIMYGPLVRFCEGLSKTTNVNYYMFTANEDLHSTRYPVAINEIANSRNELNVSRDV